MQKEVENTVEWLKDNYMSVTGEKSFNCGDKRATRLSNEISGRVDGNEVAESKNEKLCEKHDELERTPAW